MSPGRAGVGRQRRRASGPLSAAGKVTRLPRAELDEAGDQDDRPDRHRYGARQRRLLHRDRRQRDAQRKGGHSEHGPDEEVAHAHERGQPTEPRLAPPADGLAIPPQHGDQGRQHHRHHHHDPHAEERRRRAGPRLSGHPHPRHRHRPAAGHRHLAHRGHGRAPDDRAPPRWPRRAARRRPRTRPCAQPFSYSSWRRHHTPVSLRPLGARSSHWYIPQRPSSPRA